MESHEFVMDAKYALEKSIRLAIEDFENTTRIMITSISLYRDDEQLIDVSVEGRI